MCRDVPAPPGCSDDELGKLLHGRLAHILAVDRPVSDLVDVATSECPTSPGNERSAATTSLGSLAELSRPGGTNVCSATMAIVINLLDARRIAAKLVCEDAYCPGGGLARFLAREAPLITHRLPGWGAHEQINDR
jgi:hypothetical protein